MTSTEAYLVLNMLPNVGPVRVRSLLEVFGKPQAILEAQRGDLMRAHGVGPEVADSIRTWRQTVDLDGELRRIEQAAARLITLEDAAYPPLLKQISSPPLVLYVRGDLESWQQRCLAIVGSRRTTYYGRETSQALAIQLAHCGFTIVSGGARGIDAAAHEGALKIGGRTVAVLGSGLDRPYPPENEALFGRIAEAGAVITEFPFGTEPDRQTFPMRNRIVSGLSLGVLVVEAGLTSGALITATQALEQGRQVFAVPGRIDSALSKGTHKLIKEGAKLVENVEDILEEFEYLFPRKDRPGTAATVATLAAPPLSEIEEKILACVGGEESPLDGIIRESGLTSAQVSATLLALEMKKLVKQLPGKHFVRMFPVE